MILVTSNSLRDGRVVLGEAVKYRHVQVGEPALNTRTRMSEEDAGILSEMLKNEVFEVCHPFDGGVRIYQIQQDLFG